LSYRGRKAREYEGLKWIYERRIFIAT